MALEMTSLKVVPGADRDDNDPSEPDSEDGIVTEDDREDDNEAADDVDEEDAAADCNALCTWPSAEPIPEIFIDIAKS